MKLGPDKLSTLPVGVFTKSPDADGQLKNGLMDQAAVYSHQNGDVEESPARTIERDLAAGKIDAAIVWGPIAGMWVERRSLDPKWRAVSFEPDPVIKFDYKISMGLRQGEMPWKGSLNAWISSHHLQMESALMSYKVPLIDPTGHVSSNGNDRKL